MHRFVFLLSLIGCGVEDNEAYSRNKVYDVNGFEGYIQLFEQEAAMHGKLIKIDDISIVYKVLENDKNGSIKLAQCRMPNKSYSPRIEVDPIKWKKLTTVGRMLVIFHELGHCVLLYDHRDEYLSIMNTYLMDPKQFTKNENLYMDELFNPQTYLKASLNNNQNPTPMNRNKKGKHKCSQK